MYWRSYYRQSTRSRYTSTGREPQETIFRNAVYDTPADMGDYNDPLPRPRPPRRDNNPSLRSAARVRDRRQNNIVVQLYDLEAPGGRFGQAGERFSINQNVLFTSLPRTRNAVRRGTLQLGSFFIPQDMAAHPPHIIHQALYFLFRHLQDYSRTGVIDMFGAAELEIEDDPSRDFAVNRWAGMMHALCVILDNERGLGCSDMLLAEILDFFESLIRDVHNLVGWDEAAILFEAFAGIFRTTRTGLRRQVRRIWNRFDPEVQEQLLGDMRRALPVEGVDGKAHRMYRTLGY
ncbi:uncharacterized protein B0J16DRAFT_350378 [Fusarium flagelliforme]|uniref:uncharacterized protein n=1 Tax=Fusarium flagelliforme TaxID=2675880 RepID=UPI001E8D58A8|nr:uncharacterized protein B0J16DRAFT_350378 [Fusarium flagelliforme]KAH7173547.1 hypothetical protein B0J16DRAFT_350378 [Fusarium flagelliforme]